MMNDYKIRKEGNLWITRYGEEILKQNTNFVNEIWENQIYRKQKKIYNREFAIINYNQKILMEKTGVNEQDLFNYRDFEEMIINSNYKNIRIAEVYFLKENKLLMEYLEEILDKKNILNYELKWEAKEELYDLMMTFLHFEIGRNKKDKDKLVVIDPHSRK